MPGGGGMLSATSVVLSARATLGAPTAADVTDGAAGGGGHDVRARNAAALPAAGADANGGTVAVRDVAVAAPDAAAFAVTGGAFVATGDLLGLPATAGAVLADPPAMPGDVLTRAALAVGAPEATSPAAAGEDSTGGGCVLRIARAPSVSGIPAGASLTT